MRFFVLLIFGLVGFSSVARAQDCTNPDGVLGTILFNADNDVFQGCTAGAGWVALHESTGYTPDPCASSPAPGQVCADGSVYAGLSPDGNVPMFTTPADAGQFSWDDGASNSVDTTMQNCTSATPGAQASCRTGEANTALLVGLGTTPSPAPYVAARHCDALSAHGHDDWYLPAQDELDVLFDNRVAIGGFNVSGSFPAGWYWSSSEFTTNGARLQRFSDGVQGSTSESGGLSVRCVRR